MKRYSIIYDVFCFLVASTTVLTAEVKVEKIHRIEIFSRFKQINRGDKLHLRVLGYDEEGNTFSSLDGLRFDWEILNGHKNIREIPFKDTAHMGLTHGHSGERVGVEEGDDFIMKAIQEGTSKLTVRLLATGYEHIKSAEITLTIVDPFVIVPNDPSYENSIQEYQNQINILPTCQFNFKLQYVIKQDD